MYTIRCRLDRIVERLLGGRRLMVQGHELVDPILDDLRLLDRLLLIGVDTSLGGTLRLSVALPCFGRRFHAGLLLDVG